MKTTLKNAGLPALVLLAALVFGMAGCYFDLGEPRPEEQETQPKAGVLTVIGAEDGISYEAEVYDYPDDDVADAADLADLMRVFEMIGTGLDMPGEEALAIELLTPDGEDFTADGDFLVVLRDETDASAPLRYKGAVPFIGGSATIEYDEMETASRRYTVTFDLNYTDAANPPKPQEIDADGKATIPAPPKREGYAFGSWFTDAAGTGAAWDFGTDTVKKDITLYAKWTRNYTVTFDLNYTGAANPPKPQEIDEGGKATQPAAPVRTGYNFGGWHTDAAGTGAEWNFDLNTVKETITLYAKWTQIKYTVTFNSAGGTPAGIIQSVPYGSAATKPANPTRTDYGFDDWYTANADTPYNFNSTVTADIVLYAKWKPLTLAAILADMAMDAAANSTSASYTLPSGSETYTTALNLTTTNSPATVVIDGGGRVITGSANSFTVGSGVTLTLKNITFKTLPLSVAAGGTLVLDNGAVVRENNGTGVNVSGTLEMRSGSSVTQNKDTGIVLEANSHFTMNGGEISWNTGTGGSFWDDGGGMAVQGGGAVFTMNGGSIHDNAGLLNGGGIFVSEYANTCTLKLTGGEIYNNSAGYDGGGVWIYENLNATFTMSGGKIRNNHVIYNGGGVYIMSGNTFNMTGGEITGNIAGNVGGVYLYGGTLTGNPQIGGTNPGTGRGWIHGNTPNDKN